ncbi:MAG: HlyC/CorC family transporter [Erysipelotrichaceae bacterium]|nr:HlyC/CorC family transporter [Erysipelotrichaceae bacterium]
MDEGSSRIYWIFTVIILILLALFFAMCETAFASVSRNRMKTMADKGDSRAKKALHVLDHFDTAITTILICTNIVHIAAASVVTVNVTRIWGISAVTISTIITTLAVFFFGEMLPKSIARKYCDSISLSTAGILSLLMTVLSPVSWILTKIGNAAASLTKGDGDVSVTEEELYDIIEDMTEEGSLDEEQGDLISSALQFQDVIVGSVLTSRVDLVAIDVNTPQEEILDLIRRENHSRIPVYEGTVDHIIGILQIRKYIKEYLKNDKITDIRSLLDKPYFVYQTTKIDDLLNQMSNEKMNIAVVLDEYGGTLGIITVEDILEELVGEIWDEDDDAQENIIELPDGSYSVNADDLVTDVLDELHLDYNEEQEEEIENKIMSELAFEAFSEIPREGDSFRFMNMLITVQIMQQNRIIRLKVRVLPEEDEEGGDQK